MTKEIQRSLQLKQNEESGLSLLTKLWLSNDDVCRILRISKRTLQNYRDDRILPYSKLRKKIYYKAGDIQECLDRHYVQAIGQKGGLL
jgi:hypothetical protein